MSSNYHLRIKQSDIRPILRRQSRDTDPARRRPDITIRRPLGLRHEHRSVTRDVVALGVEEVDACADVDAVREAVDERLREGVGAGLCERGGDVAVLGEAGGEG